MPFGMSQHLCCERLFHHACANSQGSFSIRIQHSLDILSHSLFLRSPDHLQSWLESSCVKKETFLFSLVISSWFLEAVLEVYLEPLWLQCLVPFVTGWFHILPCVYVVEETKSWIFSSLQRWSWCSITWSILNSQIFVDTMSPWRTGYDGWRLIS